MLGKKKTIKVSDGRVVQQEPTTKRRPQLEKRTQNERINASAQGE